MNVNILAWPSVPFRPTTVQVPILALTLHETDNSVYVVSLYVKTQNDVDLAVVEARMTYSLKVRTGTIFESNVLEDFSSYS